MSAIWGIVNLDGKAASSLHGQKMEEAMYQYKIDRYETIVENNIVFGCGHQYFTKESRNERLPQFKDGLYFTADCMVDNREELLELMQIPDQGIPDGEILFRAYTFWGKKFTEHVLGVFTLAIYDAKENRCILYTDHTGSRSLYYYKTDDSIIFSTLIAPILAVMQESYEPEEKWLAGCASLVSPDMEVFDGLTPFKGVRQLGPGCCLRCSKDDESLVSYWNPTKNKVDIFLPSHEEYQKLFVGTFKTCVASVLRSDGNTGITLSSGLDSSSVACLAAEVLKEEGKCLYSYTSVPLPDYVSHLSEYHLTDESEGVKKVCRQYPNIIPTFVDCQGKNAYSAIKRLVKKFEFPYKAIHNMVWLDNIYEIASGQNCKIILKGQYGNSTISYGKITTRLFDDLSHFRFLTAYREFMLFCKKNHVSRKRFVKVTVLDVIKKIIPHKWYQKDTIVKSALLKKYKILKQINKNWKVSGGSYLDTRKQRLEFLYSPKGLSQFGAYDTRFGLIHGVILRDPTKDKRIIDLCSRLPMKCFASDGIERAMVRRYMTGIVPDFICTSYQRGRQSADFSYRLSLVWDEIEEEVIADLRSNGLKSYIDEEKLEKFLKKLEIKKTDNSQSLDHIFSQAMMLCSLSQFLNGFWGKKVAS